MEAEQGFDPEIDAKVHLHRIARELTTIRTLVATAINHFTQAESEVPERMRRFANYMHDLHSVRYMYDEQGHPPPDYLLREMERTDDRYRQILKELHIDGGVFEQIRREMAKDAENRYDHTRLLYPPKEASNETGQSDSRRNGELKEGTDPSRSLPGGS